MTKPISPSSRRPKPRMPHVISFRITEKDYTLLAHKAATADISVNDLARRICLSRVEQIVIAPSRAVDPALITQIHYIGHNLNQMAKRMHMSGRISPHVDDLCRRIEALIDEAIA